jgi:hypothetical protein
MQVIGLRRPFPVTSITLLLVLFSLLATTALADPEQISPSQEAEIINKYLQAKSHDNELRGASMEVEISAEVPKLKESGTLRALRKISRVGQITYKQIAFQGAKFVKNEIIARYLSAEQQEQGDQDIGITPANYKFKYKGEVPSRADTPAYIFQLTPRKKKVGLFKGEMWIDSKTYLPVFEKGRLVKNPSVFFKKVDFRRGFAIQNGMAVPAYLASTIDTRLVGKIEININFSKFTQNQGAEADEETTADSAVTHQTMLK